MDGGASMEGYINNLWDSLLERLPDAERVMAENRKAEALAAREEAALALLAKIEGEAPTNATDLAQMSFDELSQYLEYDPMAYVPQKLEDGHNVFIKARCANCHVFGTKGKGGGPDLSTVTSRFRRRDILESIMYPSKVVSDQYTGVEVELNDFSTVTGMVAGEDTKTLTVITITGERVTIPKRSITKRTESKQSMMPEGLLNTMTLEELVSLIYFLEHGGEE
jgi:putative heme-binding domain-containing protein